jgi:hypothetical protein
MLRWIGAVMLAAAVISGGSPVKLSAMAAEAASTMPAADATASGTGARRHTHHQHYAYRPYYPYYLGRPYYYSPGPFFLPDAPSWARGWDQWW